MLLPIANLFQIVTIFYMVTFTSAATIKEAVSSVYEAFGYSPVCVSSALTSCELSSNKDFAINVVDSIVELKSLLQGMKLELENISRSLSNEETILHEGNKDGQSLNNSTTAVDIPMVQPAVLSMNQEIKEANNFSSEEENQDQKLWKNCAEMLIINSDSTSGVRTIYPNGDPSSLVEVYCDQVTDGGGWTVIQKRDALPVRETFERPWLDYVQGFGDLKGEFWLGLQNIHALTNSTRMELRIDLQDYESEKRYAKYGKFYVGDEDTNFVLSIDSYSGDAGDSMPDHNGMMFSTHDRDNDLYEGNCAKKFRGAWWFNRCHRAHLNGFPHSGKLTSPYLAQAGIYWSTWRSSYYYGRTYSYKKAIMKIRPVSLF